MDDEDIRIIKDKGELEGTAYIEVLAGAYQHKCWVDGSLFFDEEAFGYLEPTIERHVPGYDHYAFTEIAAETWATITQDLTRLRQSVQGAQSTADMEGVGFFFKETASRFDAEFDAKREALCAMIEEFCTWVTLMCRTHRSLTVLGI